MSERDLRDEIEALHAAILTERAKLAAPLDAELSQARTALQKVLAEAQAEVAARQAQLSQALAALTRQRDELNELVASREAALTELEYEAAQIDDDWKTSRREAAAARKHLAELRLSDRRG